MLRSIVAHVGAIVLPQAISVAAVQTKFSPAGRVLDPAAEQAVRSLGTSVLRYLEEAVCPKRRLAEMTAEATVAASAN